MAGLSISFVVGKASQAHQANIEHNNREFVAGNVNASRVKENISYVRQNVREAYKELFSEAVSEFNEIQKANHRLTRMKKDYYDEISGGDREEAFYELIVAFGDKNTATCGTPTGELAKKMLDEYIRGFQKRNPNLHIFNAVMHLDESEPHLHIDVIPFYDETCGRKNGLKKGVSMKAALNAQGFTAKSMKKNQLVFWEDSEREVLTKILNNHGISRDVKNDRHKHMDVEQFKQHSESLKLKRRIKERISDSEKLSPQEVEIIRSNLSAERARRKNLERENAKLKTGKLQKFVIGNEQKLSYVLTALENEKIDFKEDVHGFTVTEAIAERVRKIEKSYKPEPKITWRDKTKLDIDRLIYSVKSVDELLEKLREKGYEVKRGKYISVKPKGAERSIRTRSLGGEYTEDGLAQRIRDNRKYENITKARYEKSSGMSREFFAVTNKVVVLFYEQRKFPRRYNADKPWTMTNDYHINELTNCVKLINERGITGGEDLSARVETVTDKIRTARSRTDEVLKMQSDIKEVEAKAKYYFSSADKSNANQMDKMRLSVAKEVLDEYEIKSRGDVDVLMTVYEKNIAELAELKQEIADSETELKQYEKLREIYDEVQGGTYVDRLVKQENERRVREQRDTGLEGNNAKTKIHH